MPKKQKNKIRILIVDDHPAVREVLAIRISHLPEWKVCGEAANIAEALQLVASTKPDVAIIDISLKTGDGIDLIKRIKARSKGVRMLVWSMHSENLYAERALRAGAMGYITKDQATDQIVEAIRQILAGKVYLSEDMAAKLLHRAVGKREEQLSRSPLDTLSDRELEVFRWIGHGLKTQEIAIQLHLSVKTIETYRDRIREKFDLSDGTELARYAVQWALENC